MSNSNKHIEEFLDYYLNKEQSPDYAVLITGCWGSGKTYFIRKYLEGKGAAGKDVVKTFDWLTDCEKYAVVYVSLFGAKSREEMDKRVLEKLHPILNSDYLKSIPTAVSTIAKLLKEYSVNPALKATGAVAEIATPFLAEVLPNIIKDEGGKTKGAVVIFDDVERADMPLPELLGYMNEYVEHLHVPCILLADKEKWEEAQKCQEDKSTLHHLSSTKEKVIGKEFQIQTTFEDVWTFWSDFNHHPVGNRTWKVIKDFGDVLSNILKSSGMNNYRALKNSLSDFRRFIGEEKKEQMFIEDDYLNKPVFLRLLFADFICHQYSYYLGNLKPEDIPSNLTNFHAAKINEEIEREEKSHDKKNKSLVVYSKFEKKFDSVPRISDIAHNGVSLKDRSSDWCCIWKNWLENSYVDSQEVMDLISNSIFYNEKDSHNLNQLLGYYYLSDEEAYELWMNLTEKFKNREFKNPNFVFTLFFQWLSLSYDGVTEKNVQDLFDDMKKYIQEVAFDGTPFAGNQLLMNHEQLKDDEITKELLNLIADKCPYDIDYANKVVLNRLYSYMENPSKNVDIPFTIKIETRFPFERIDILRFIDCYTRREFKEKRFEMCNCIASRMKNIKNKSFEQYNREIAVLNQIENEITKVLANKPIPPSKLSLKILKDEIGEIKKNATSLCPRCELDPNAPSIHPGFTNKQLQAFLGIAAVAALEDNSELTRAQFLVIITKAISQVLGKNCRVTAFKNVNSQKWTIVN